MTHVYALSVTPRFPNPVAEIQTLARVQQGGGQAFLALVERAHPPLSGQRVRAGDIVYFVVKVQGGIDVHAQAQIGQLHHGATPQSVLNLYGPLRGRFFREITNITLHNPPLGAAQIGFTRLLPDFLAGQAYMRSF